MLIFVTIIFIVAFLFSTLGLLVNEQFIIALIVDIALASAYMYYINQRSYKKLLAEAKKIGATDVIKCRHVEGLGIANGESCNVYSFDDRIEISSNVSNQTFTIPLDRIRALVTKNEAELKDVDRSVVGRAIIGTLLVPGLGTIVGGMSGLKQKKRGQQNHYLIINYIDKNGELKGVTMLNNVNIVRLRTFSKSYNTKLSGKSVEL